MGNGTQLSVRELLAEPTLKLRLVAGEAALDAAVRGIHLSDLRDPTPWLTPGSVLLTTGPTFAADAEVGVRLVEQLKGIESAALGVALGHHLDEVSPAMTERAEQLKLALFEVSPGVPLRLIVDYVYQALASSDLHRLRRLVAVQNHLLDLFTGEQDRTVEEVLTGVASTLDMPLTLFDSQGDVLAQTGEVSSLRSPDRLWRAYSTSKDGVGPLGVVESAHSRFYFREATMLGKVQRVLALAVPHSADTQFVEMALAFLQRLLSLDLLRQRDALLVARRIRSHLLQDFLSTKEVPPEEVALRLEREGIDPQVPWRVVICVPSAPRSRRTRGVPRPSGPAHVGGRDAMIAAAEQFLLDRRMAQLGTVDDWGIVILSPFPDRDDRAVREVLTDLQCAVEEAVKPLLVQIGCSSEKAGLTGGARALHEAQEALTLAMRDVDGVVLFDEIRGRYRVIDGQSDETLSAIYERTIALLAETDTREQTRLLETLSALLDNQLAMQSTADALYIHRNTLQKRLQRIERLLDVDLNRLDDIVELYLGLRAAELLGYNG